MRMKKSVSRSRPRRIDGAFFIRDLASARTFSLVHGTLDGTHPARPTVNRRSDRAYFILSGSGSIRVGARRYRVRPNDLVLVRKLVPHQLRGRLRCLVITAPRFDPKDERLLKK